MLDVIQEVDELSKANQALSSDGIKGTDIGYDSDTQINTFVDDSQIKFIRQVENNLQMQVSKDGSYNIRIEQGGKVNAVSTNGGSSSTINIKQGS